MKPQSIRSVYFIVILLSVFVVVFSSVVFIKTAKEDHNTLDNLITFVVTILSVVIALLAYHISVKTYVSIDAVNAISRMDGNVMENENYRTGLLSLMRRFNSKSKEEICDSMLGYLEERFDEESINSGARLADSIQEMIDVIVLFSFVIERQRTKGAASDEIRRIEALIGLIEARVDDFEQLSEGSCILMRESVRLLKAVYNHQCYEAGYHRFDDAVLLIDVRGTMLKNAISRTIYFNYMGLFFMSKSMKTINGCLVGFDSAISDAFSIDAAPLLRSLPRSSEKNLAVIYLEEALRNFTNAVEPIRDELMWNAFIQYNKARAEYLLTALGAGVYDWESTLKSAIDYRSKLVAVLDDVLGIDEKTFFQRAFTDQLKMAQLMWIRLRLASGSISEPDEELPEVGTDEFHRMRKIHDDIVRHVCLRS